METLNTIEKITLLVSTGIVCLANLFVMLERIKKREKQNTNHAIQKLMTINLKTNNKIMKAILSITLFLSSFLVNAQDTIYFKNATIIVVKITEVGISEIKYQRLDNLTGPNYLSAKSEISLIRYSNGVTDSIKSTPSPVITITEFTVNPNAVRLRGNKIIYHNKAISDMKLRSMITDHPSTDTQIRLKNEFKKLKEFKLMEGAVAPVLFLAGAGIHLAALGSALGGNGGAGSNNRNALVSAFVGGAILRISGHVINIVYRNKKKAKRAQIVNIYNDFQ